MHDIHTLSDAQLKRYQKLFEPGTQEYVEIQGILLMRRWSRLYGQPTAINMYRIWLKMGTPDKGIDLIQGKQLELPL